MDNILRGRIFAEKHDQRVRDINSIIEIAAKRGDGVSLSFISSSLGLNYKDTLQFIKDNYQHLKTTFSVDAGKIYPFDNLEQVCYPHYNIATLFFAEMQKKVTKILVSFTVDNYKREYLVFDNFSAAAHHIYDNRYNGTFQWFPYSGEIDFDDLNANIVKSLNCEDSKGADTLSAIIQLSEEILLNHREEERLRNESWMRKEKIEELLKGI